jgi:hypothetical protein
MRLKVEVEREEAARAVLIILATGFGCGVIWCIAGILKFHPIGTWF